MPGLNGLIDWLDSRTGIKAGRRICSTNRCRQA
jgi:hypothetical protein